MMMGVEREVVVVVYFWLVRQEAGDSDCLQPFLEAAADP